MSDVISIAPADVRLWVSLDVHKFSIVAATLPPAGGTPEVCRIETTEKAIRRFIEGWNDRCEPFVWTKDADTILARANRQANSETVH